MKYVNYLLLIAAIAFAFLALYYWAARAQIDYAALCLAVATGLHAVYLHSTKANKAG